MTDGERHQTLGARLLGHLGEFVDLAAGVIADAGRHDGPDGVACFDRLSEHPEAAVLHDVVKVVQAHVEAQVGLVAAVEVHGLAMRQPGEGGDDAPFGSHRANHLGEQGLRQVEDVFFLDE